MVLHVVFFCDGMGFSRCDNVLCLVLQFLDSLDGVGFNTLVELDCWMDSMVSEVDL